MEVVQWCPYQKNCLFIWPQEAYDAVYLRNLLIYDGIQGLTDWRVILAIFPPPFSAVLMLIDSRSL